MNREDLDLDEVREAISEGRTLKEVAAGFEIPESTLRGWLKNGPESANGHAPGSDAAPDGERPRQGRQRRQRARNGASKLRTERRRARQNVETACANGSEDLKAVDAFLASRWASLDRLERLRRLLG